jgi:hypothetical protein
MSIQQKTGTTKQDLSWLNRSRHDIVQAYPIEIAISIVRQLGTRHAAAFLKKYTVDIDVALRVLLRPSQRRRYDGLDKFTLEGILPGLPTR